MPISSPVRKGQPLDRRASIVSMELSKRRVLSQQMRSRIKNGGRSPIKPEMGSSNSVNGHAGYWRRSLRWRVAEGRVSRWSGSECRVLQASHRWLAGACSRWLGHRPPEFVVVCYGLQPSLRRAIPSGEFTVFPLHRRTNAFVILVLPAMTPVEHQVRSLTHRNELRERRDRSLLHEAKQQMHLTVRSSAVIFKRSEAATLFLLKSCSSRFISRS